VAHNPERRLYVEWGELDRMPCAIKLMPNPRKSAGFHDLDEYERLLGVARKRGGDVYLMVLLGGDDGLRLGEIVGLEWRDVDLAARRLTLQRSDWLGHVTVPKSGRLRRVPMTQRRTAALKQARHLRSDRVLCLPDGSPITRDRVIKAIRSVQRSAGVVEGVRATCISARRRQKMRSGCSTTPRLFCTGETAGKRILARSGTRLARTS
jgi:integrase